MPSLCWPCASRSLLLAAPRNLPSARNRLRHASVKRSLQHPNSTGLAGSRARVGAVFAANASEVPNLREREPGIPAHGWQYLASLVVRTSFRAREVLPRLPPAGQALLRSQAGPHAGAWLTAIPSEEGATLTPNLMHIALRRRLRLPLPPAAQCCGQGAGRHGCGDALDPLGDHALACPRSGLLARRADVLEHVWIRVPREAIGSEGRVVPQPWLAHTNLATASGQPSAAWPSDPWPQPRVGKCWRAMLR